MNPIMYHNNTCRRNRLAVTAPVRLLSLFLLRLTYGVAHPLSAVNNGDGNVTALYVSVSGHDIGDCSSASSPCATLKYAVEDVAAFMTPVEAPVPILLTAGHFPVSSCGISSSRPLNISGAGKQDTFLDCGGTARLLFISTSLWISSLTAVNGNSTDDGGGIAVFVNATDSRLVVALRDLAVVNCTAHGSGGGIALKLTAYSDVETTIFVAYVDVMDCKAVDGHGGGMYLNGSGDGSWNVSITDGLFSRNTLPSADSNDSPGDGAICAFVMPLAGKLLLACFNSITFRNVAVRCWPLLPSGRSRECHFCGKYPV